MNSYGQFAFRDIVSDIFPIRAKWGPATRRRFPKYAWRHWGELLLLLSKAPLLGGIASALVVFFGLFPALHSTRPELISTLRSGAGHLAGSKGASRFRATLVTANIAAATRM